MRLSRAALALSSCFAGFLLFTACGDDTEDVTVRERLDAGGVADAADDGALPCGVTVPTAYESAGFEANTNIERHLRARFEALSDAMRATEGESSTTTTAAELKAIYNDGAPSLRAVSSSVAQGIIEPYLDEYGEITGETWEPADADGDGGVESGGKYGAYYFSKTGVDLREATEKTLLSGALYNHVLGIVNAPMTEASVDRLVVAFGASRSLGEGAEPDALVAEYASKRDGEPTDAPGPYRNVKAAVLTMKAAVTAADQCKAELDEAIATYLREWERASFATAIHALHAATRHASDPAKGAEALRAYGEAVGFIQGFKGLPADKRTIQDAQIDALLAKIGADTPYKLVTSPGERALKLSEAIADIALYQGFTPEELERFKSR